MHLKSATFKKYLPHQSGRIQIADGSLETRFIFLKNVEIRQSYTELNQS